MARPRGILGRACGSLGIETWTERRSSNSATRTIHKHSHETARSPARSFDVTHPACAGLGELREGLRPLPPHRPTAPGDTCHPRRCNRFGLRATKLSGASRGFTSQRPAGSRRPTPHAPCPKAGDGAFPRLDPLGHLSSRDHGGTGRNPGPGATGPKPSSAAPVSSPRGPFLTSKRKDVGLRGLCTVCFRETGDRADPTLTACAACAHLPEPARWNALTTQRDRGQGPPHPNLREEARDPLHPRCLPSASYLPGKPELSPEPSIQVGHCPQVVANLWKTLGAAFKLLRTPTVLTYRGRRILRLRCAGTEPKLRTSELGSRVDPHHRAGNPTSPSSRAHQN